MKCQLYVSAIAALSSLSILYMREKAEGIPKVFLQHPASLSVCVSPVSVFVSMLPLTSYKWGRRLGRAVDEHVL